ncbi:hypothetical protein BU15DRAFT_68171 [Melanogaster broomeanus]|nr:hypothetical protein BU15DRAFT_68171 [Melanogaster broomeanus]
MVRPANDDIQRTASVQADNDMSVADNSPTDLSVHVKLVRTALPLAACPHYDGRISTFNSASSRFYAPSDLSGIGGMHTEFIRSTPLWRNEGPRKDCVFVTTDPEALGMCALDIAHVLSFFSFTYREGTSGI